MSFYLSEMTYQDWSGVGYIKENIETGESGWMLSGSISGGMTAWGLDRWPAYFAAKISNPNTEFIYDSATATFIEKITHTDMQIGGVVGVEFEQALQVRVLSEKKNAVPNVDVTFTVKKGNGKFSGNGQASIVVQTNEIGIASVKFKAGENTKDNAAYMVEEGKPYEQQVGENIIDASLSSGTRIAFPFTEYAYPGPATKMRKLYGDGGGAILSLSGFIAVSVEDKFDNPISNKEVTFKVLEVSTNSQCIMPNNDSRGAILVKTSDSCLTQSPSLGSCSTAGSPIVETTRYQGAAVQVILGSIPEETYSFQASAEGIQPIKFTQTAYPFGNCGGNTPPQINLVLAPMMQMDVNGHNINAGKKNTELPVAANIYFLTEDELEKDEALMCGDGTKNCSKIIGKRTYAIDRDMDMAETLVTFSGQGGTTSGNGAYTGTYTLPSNPGEYTVNVAATAKSKNKVRRSFNTCSGCFIDPEAAVSGSTSATMQVYSVDISLNPFPTILLDEWGYAVSDYNIGYSILPAAYSALSAYVFIYKDDTMIAAISSEKQGAGFATIARGFQFDVNSAYEVEVVLNYGTGVEMRGDKKPISVAQLRVLTDETPSKEPEEIKFSDGSNNSNGTKKYHIEIKSQALLTSCETITGRIVTLSTAPATAGKPVSTPQNTSDDYASEYPLHFISSGKECLLKITDTVDGYSKKEKFIISNRPRTQLDVGFPSNISKTAVLYAGIGNNLMIEVGGLQKVLPIEPVGVVVLGIDGLRQDVLYEKNEQRVVDRTGPDSPYYTDLSEVKGFCAVMGGKYDDGWISSSCDPTGAADKHIKLKDVTTIFPSITFAAWASIFTGKTPNETGITGNEFFARDMLANYETIPGMYMLPSGMVTLDGDGGAFRPLVPGAYSLLSKPLPFILNFIMPADFGIYSHPTLQAKLDASAPGHALRTEAKPLWADINTLVAKRYKRTSDARCDTTENECRTVSMFNQYAEGADWWGTSGSASKASFDAVQLPGAAGNAYTSSLMDSSSSVETATFIDSYFPDKIQNGKRKNFPALLSVYLSGLDHYAHVKGMDEYANYLKSTTDDNVKKIVNALKNKDEFDNKIFIIVSDHGETAMPTDLKYKETSWLSLHVDKDAEMSCELKTDFADPQDTNHITSAQKAEQANNSLHIWELANLFAQFPDPNILMNVLVPEQIAKLPDLAAVATANINQANIVAALNGPMAHIYVKGTTWQDNPDEVTMDSVLINLYSILKEGASATGKLAVQINEHFPKLGSSIDNILVRWTLNGAYEVITGISEDASGSVTISTDTLDSLSNTGYQKAVDRITNMNHKDRSGDIILLMKDSTTGDATDRYSTAYACKAWHGSLNASDSYVPFVVAYPGGNKSELDPFLSTVCPGNTCDGNWILSDMIKEITKKQYSGQ